MTRIQQLGIDRLPPAERVALAREILASVAASAPPAWASLPVSELTRSAVDPPAPADEWERRVFGAAIDCGVSVPDAALSSDGLYD